ncbi:glutathione S-transferase [Phanerochaete sordida]|uniref:glutathione transferase n=1 Tax=Phanerochaete sordida TaxID=48140 RepID=A0A9P3GQ80_9APHY|nr:glutathione S-transferase [Phanerochaete sordida]
MSHGKQFTLYTHKRGPNGWKVAIVLEELGLTYESIYFDFKQGEHKASEHTNYNPNGRIPTIIDHANADYVLWESDAILYYLVEHYDPLHRVSVSEAGDKFHQLQWLFFQSSGQGPYFGQAAWFIRYHHEQLPSAQERYKAEIRRVLGVLESVLEKQQWLVGGIVTIADLAFVPWNDIAIPAFVDFDFAAEFPATAAWHDRLHARPSVKKIVETRAAVNAA